MGCGKLRCEMERKPAGLDAPACLGRCGRPRVGQVAGSGRRCAACGAAAARQRAAQGVRRCCAGTHGGGAAAGTGGQLSRFSGTRGATA